MKLWQALGLTGLGAGVAYVVWRHVKTSNGSGPSMSSSSSTSPAISTTPAAPATTISTPLSSNTPAVQIAPAATLPHVDNHPLDPLPSGQTAQVVPMATPGSSAPELATLQNMFQQVSNLSPAQQAQLMQMSQQMQTLFPGGNPTPAQMAASPQAQALLQQMQTFFPGSSSSIPAGTTPAGYAFTVQDAEVYSAPNPTSKHLGFIPQGSPVSVSNLQDGFWYATGFNRETAAPVTGYVSALYLNVPIASTTTASHPVDMAPAITSGRVRGVGPNGNPHRRVRRP